MTKQTFEQRYAAMNHKDKQTVNAAIYMNQLDQLRMARKDVRKIYEMHTNDIRKKMRLIHEQMRELK